MAVKIKLMRLGKIRQPYYRIVVADARTRRNGKSIETIGKYHPKEEPSFIEVDSERAQYWLGVGAQPTESVENILKITGDWQRFKGLPGAEGTLRRAEPKPDKAAVFAQALAEAGGEIGPDATTPRKKSTRRADAPKARGDEPAAPAAEPTADTAAEPAADGAAGVVTEGNGQE
ncbi:MAG: 30S ribosomal protein S16 [Actinomycetota bacterium]|nr:30S ribosomal protein S16 [Actinomycetota bacterium]